MSRTAQLGRRQFVQSSLATGAALLTAHQLSKLPTATAAADSWIDIMLDEPIGRIAPEIYGHFAEHLGGVVYDGIWVGENSKIPNVGGIRLALVEALKKIKASAIRWPGGCFADSYNWRDGIGPRKDRPRRANSGLTLPNGLKARRTARGNTTPIISALTSFYASANFQVRNLIWRQTCAA